MDLFGAVVFTNDLDIGWFLFLCKIKIRCFCPILKISLGLDLICVSGHVKSWSPITFEIESEIWLEKNSPILPKHQWKSPRLASFRSLNTQNKWVCSLILWQLSRAVIRSQKTENGWSSIQNNVTNASKSTKIENLCLQN